MNERTTDFSFTCIVLYRHAVRDISSETQWPIRADVTGRFLTLKRHITRFIQRFGVRLNLSRVEIILSTFQTVAGNYIFGLPKSTTVIPTVDANMYNCTRNMIINYVHINLTLTISRQPICTGALRSPDILWPTRNAAPEHRCWIFPAPACLLPTTAT
jgi:hypothetical protein